nr:SDR family oxidoreductase [Chloroflexota bacterium]
MNEPRVALVTGSARGMGRAMAEVLAAAGHRVVGLDRLEQEPGPLERVIAADLLDPSVPAGIVAELSGCTPGFQRASAAMSASQGTRSSPAYPWTARSGPESIHR